MLIFAGSKQSVLYQQQLAEFASADKEFRDRDLIILHLFSDGNSFSENQEISARDAKRLRNEFNIEKSQFTIILMGKDGTEKLREEELLSTDRLFNVIDAMPMRQREMKQKHY